MRSPIRLQIDSSRQPESRPSTTILQRISVAGDRSAARRHQAEAHGMPPGRAGSFVDLRTRALLRKLP
ncbi:hypothetical protein BDY21DRAFT_357249 [Lineolata rhizophorae]|uniref:Uncharacterized protein n=1 Tax=Lineolata rhizophorae TaxID=578093 RepID=A0A6A6NNP0_9PEZI|nr:hypothetical protein BDY21DRAFT_357249 [Lineolata rhizophorae]